jgi:hypothetical protein
MLAFLLSQIEECNKRFRGAFFLMITMSSYCQEIYICSCYCSFCYKYNDASNDNFYKFMFY